MTDQKIIGILQEDLVRKCEAVNISIISYPNISKNAIDYTIIDLDTGAKEFLEEKMIDDNIHEAAEIYDKIIAVAQRLVNARYDKDDDS